MCPAISSHYTNVSSYLFTLHHITQICPALSSYYVNEMFKCVQLSLRITPVKCTSVYSCSVVPHIIHSKLLISFNVSCTSDQIMNFKVECGHKVAKGLDYSNVEWLDGSQLWIWSYLSSVLFWDIAQRIVVICCFFDFLTLEDWTCLLSRSVGKELPLYAAKYSRRAQISYTAWQKLEITHWSDLKGTVDGLI
jgi:hypothetical protein